MKRPSITVPSIRGRVAAGRGLAVLLAGALVLAACGSAEEAPEESEPDGTEDRAETEDAAEDAVEQETASEPGLRVVATTSILGDIVASIAGDDAEVITLMPPGVDPHAYQPSADDGRLLREADLVVANGLGLEEYLLDTLAAAEEEGVRVLRLADQLDPLAFPDDGHEHDDEPDDGHDDEHDHGPEDPHVWFDPLRMADGAVLIGAELAAVDDVRATDWTDAAERYAGELREVHSELEAWFATIPDDRRRIVTNHEALGYLADRYDLEVIATVIPGASTQVETDPRSFAELVETVEELDVEVVFAENTDSTVLADQLASEVLGRGDVELEVVHIYTGALGEPGSGAEDYVGLLRTTATLITEALGGQV